MAEIFEVHDGEQTTYYRRRKEALEHAKEYHEWFPTRLITVDKVKTGKINMTLVLDILNNNGFSLERKRIKEYDTKKNAPKDRL